MSELVNHPSHYNKSGRKECIVEMEERYGAEYTAIFCLMNAYKYLYRAGEKFGNPARQDLNKAKWYFAYAKKLAVQERKPFLGCFALWYDVERELGEYEFK